ncbi:hypothetical protein [Sulfuricurvum sp.]|uniref:hypothetical protein n=1 Tax=Sulfuricurvum sp. TaxID=2025608 RepID=UPI003BB59073
MSTSLYSTIELLERYELESEIIMVDYNPPADRALLKDILHLNGNRKYVSVRFIEVPNSIHTAYPQSDKMPMNNMVARNAGIRRARGEFILSTGIDVIFSTEMIAFFAHKNLDRNSSYRTSRIDVAQCVSAYAQDIDKLMESCRNNIIDVHFNTNPGYFGDTDLPALHTNNCGDFQLLHRDVWNNLCGYPEIDLIGTHADTIFSYMAWLYGAKEKVLREHFYHIDHPARWLKPVYTHVLRNFRALYAQLGEEVMALKEDYYALAKKASEMSGEQSEIELKGISMLSKDAYTKIITDMASGIRELNYNTKEWGLGDIVLKDDMDHSIPHL